MNKRIFKSVKLSYIFALVIGALFMIQKVDAKDITSDYKLEGDIKEGLIVKKGSNVTIDLNGHNITTTNEDSIKIENGATLTLKGNGNIEAVGENYASIYNNGTVIMNDVTVLKDESKGKYYAILNHGDITIKSGTVKMNNYVTSSLIDNGYSSYNSGNEKTGYIKGVNNENPSLTIENGTFDGGRNTVKNDDNSSLIINGGIYKNNVQVAVMNWNIATINGGTFEVPTGNDKTALFNGTAGIDSVNKGILVINDGIFKAENLLEGTTITPIAINGGDFKNITKSIINKENRPNDNLDTTNVKISSGTYNIALIPNDYLKDGYEVYDKDDYLIIDKESHFELKKVIYYVEKGKTIKLDYTSNDIAKKYLITDSEDKNIATIKGDEITGVSVGKTYINLFLAGPLEAAEVIVYEVKSDTATKNETTNLNSLINDIANNKTPKGLDKETSTKLLEAINNNKTISTELNTKEVKSSEVSKETKEKIQKVLNKEEKVAAFFDINVLIKADNNSIGKITELENTVLVSVDVPTTLPELKTGFTRKYYVIRIHNGETTKLEAKLVNGKIEFKTDKFSDYVLTYTDEATKEETKTDKGKLDDVPKTSSINYTIMFIIISLMTIISIKILKRN